MNILFLSLIGYTSINNHDLYTDLLRVFINDGHKVYILSPAERRQGIGTGLIEEENSTILRIKTGNIQKTNVIEKGISTVLIDYQFIVAVRKYFADVKFDMVLYPTPPITLVKTVEYVKRRDKAKTYLMLKDIFPQNAVDIGMMSTNGVKGVLYKFFRRKEKKLYAVSDRIGCMSPANMDYLKRHNPEIDSTKIELCPNSIDIQDITLSNEEKLEIREKYNLPIDKKIFVYGGNLGRPQGIPFIVECLKVCSDKDVLFLIIGDGIEYEKLSQYVTEEKPQNVILLKRLPKDDYDRMIGACDVGLIFLDHRFTIPNFPGRLLSYMQAKIPVLAATDVNTDIGKVITEGSFGWWCESNDCCSFANFVDIALSSDIPMLGKCGFEYLEKNYSVEQGYRKIMGKRY